MSGYLGDLSSSQKKSLEELKDMLTGESLTDEVIKRDDIVSQKSAGYCHYCFIGI